MSVRNAWSAIYTIFTVFDYSRSSGTTRLSDSECVRTICAVCNSHFRAETRSSGITFIAFSSVFAGSSIFAIFTIFDYSRSSGTIRLCYGKRMSPICAVCDSHFRAETRSSGITFITFSSVFAWITIFTWSTVFDYSTGSRTIRLSNSERMTTICSICNSYFRTETRNAISTIFTIFTWSTIFARFALLAIFDNGRSSRTIGISDSELVPAIRFVCDSYFRTKSRGSGITFITFITFSSVFAWSAIFAIFTVTDYSGSGRAIRLSDGKCMTTIRAICDADFRTESVFAIFAVLAINTIFAVMNCRACCYPIIICDRDSVCSIFISCNGYIRIYAVIKS